MEKTEQELGEEFALKYERYQPLKSEHAWAVKAGSIVGVLAVLRDSGMDNEEMTWRLLDELFGTMPVALSLEALSVTDLALKMVAEQTS